MQNSNLQTKGVECLPKIVWIYIHTVIPSHYLNNGKNGKAITCSSSAKAAGELDPSCPRERLKTKTQAWQKCLQVEENHRMWSEIRPWFLLWILYFWISGFALWKQRQNWLQRNLHPPTPRANSPLLSIFIILHKPLHLWLTSPALGRSRENSSNHSHWSYDSTPIPRALKNSIDWSDELLTSFCCDWGLARQHKVYPISYTSTSSSTTWSMTSTLTTAAQSGWKCGLSYISHKPPLYNAAAPARGVSV